MYISSKLLDANYYSDIFQATLQMLNDEKAAMMELREKGEDLIKSLRGSVADGLWNEVKELWKKFDDLKLTVRSKRLALNEALQSAAECVSRRQFLLLF